MCIEVNCSSIVNEDQPPCGGRRPVAATRGLILGPPGGVPKVEAGRTDGPAEAQGAVLMGSNASFAF